MQKWILWYWNRKCDIAIEKQKIHQYKRPISIKNKDINKTVVFNQVSFKRF